MICENKHLRTNKLKKSLNETTLKIIKGSVLAGVVSIKLYSGVCVFAVYFSQFNVPFKIISLILLRGN